ncbi:hypothetical protein LWP59_17840 [Amycolatopsis acidiphila]|nr:hypothetical protein [Amycolatopsis acidiphila]UIJ63365.1 hypothetical protein LWP59_17840 [Amycolatopsis acidiphila]
MNDQRRVGQHRHQHRGRERSREAQRQSQASHQLRRAEQQRERPPRPPAERLEEARGARHTVTAEPAEQLLRAVTGHQESDHRSKKQQTDVHHKSPPSKWSHTLLSIK